VLSTSHSSLPFLVGGAKIFLKEKINIACLWRTALLKSSAVHQKSRLLVMKYWEVYK
jgi:hypothetical protein